MGKQKTENVLKDFFDLELPVFKPVKRTESIFDLEVMKAFDSVDGLANSILFKTKNSSLTIPKLNHKVKERKKANNTIFFPPKHKKLSKIISIVSPSEAREAVRKIKKLVGKGFTKKQLRASLILAGARAKALAKKSNISSKERKELKKVAEIYFRGARQI